MMRIQIGDRTGSAEIDSLGAQLMSLQNADGLEYLWQGDPAYWGGRAPVLFPIVGMLRGGSTRIDGKSYEMKRHGFARTLEHEVESRADGEVVFLLRSSDATKTMYPFDFELRTAFRFSGGVLENRFMVTHTGDGQMPFAIGGHPAFRCPLLPGERFEDYSIVFSQKETAALPRIDMQTGLIDFAHREAFLNEASEIPLKHDLFAQDALVFDSLKSDSVRLQNRATGKGVEMRFAGFPMLGIWSAGNNAPFVALEPWYGCADAADSDGEFLHKQDIRVLKPGEKAESVFTVQLH